MNNFRRARLILGLTQREVAEELGVSTVSVNKWETGKGLPKAKRLPDVAHVLHTTVPELLDGPAERRLESGAVAECG